MSKADSSTNPYPPGTLEYKLWDISAHSKNPFRHNTPEAQLWENMRHHETLAKGFASEAEERLKKATEARENAGKFQAALAKILAHDANEAKKNEQSGAKDNSGATGDS